MNRPVMPPPVKSDRVLWLPDFDVQPLDELEPFDAL